MCVSIVNIAYYLILLPAVSSRPTYMCATFAANNHSISFRCTYMCTYDIHMRSSHINIPIWISFLLSHYGRKIQSMDGPVTMLPETTDRAHICTTPSVQRSITGHQI